MNSTANPNDPMLVLETERLVLEPLVESHAEEMWPLLRDPELYHHLEAPPPASLEELRSKYEKLESRCSRDGSQVWLNWVVREKDGPAMGFVQATLIGTDAWVGYVFGQAFWGQGYALEANRSMIEGLAQSYGVKRCLASVDRDNTASTKLLERLEFRVASSGEFGEHGYPATDDQFTREL